MTAGKPTATIHRPAAAKLSARFLADPDCNARRAPFGAAICALQGLPGFCDGSVTGCDGTCDGFFALQVVDGQRWGKSGSRKAESGNWRIKGGEWGVAR